MDLLFMNVDLLGKLLSRDVKRFLNFQLFKINRNRKWISSIQDESPTFKVDFDFQVETLYMWYIWCYQLEFEIDFDSRTFGFGRRNSYDP